VPPLSSFSRKAKKKTNSNDQVPNKSQIPTFKLQISEFQNKFIPSNKAWDFLFLGL